MKSLTLTYDKIMVFLLSILFIGVIILEMASWEYFFHYGVLSAIAAVSIISHRWKFSINIFIISMLSLGLYSYISSLWAIRPQDCFQMGNGMIFICFFSIFLFTYYDNSHNIKAFFTVLKISGYFIAVYEIMRYGFNGLRIAGQAAENRLGNDYANGNSIALLIAYAGMITFFEIIYEGKRSIIDLLLIPSFIALAALQSRKAIILIFVGLTTPYLLKNMNDKNKMKAILKIVIGVAGLVVFVVAILQLPIFNGIAERMLDLINNYRGIRQNNYIPIRERLLTLGIEAWRENPLFGYGMANAHILAADAYGFDAYLHNNYIELLVGGGIFGFLIYYSVHAYILFALTKYRKGNKSQVAVGYMFLFATMLMDWGQVSYYSKPECFILLFQVINVQCLKRNSRYV